MNKILLKYIGFFLLGLFLLPENTLAQNKTSPKADVFVDEAGVMRWGHNKEEVKGFGVNYSAPFAHGYRSAQKLGVDLKQAIDHDVYHFSRLDFDLYRIHVWDTEISDAEGNLLENEHLELFDYLLNQLKDRGINFMITPIAFWGNGWPEPDEKTPGFSNKYGKANSLTDPAAITAQENYLAQFLNHVNPYTGIAYRNEPNIIAFEVSNEPHHNGTAEEVTNFVQRMVNAMRSTGMKKPIFYNVSHSVHLADAYFDADIQGGTFQWYPTGLGFQKELEGNLLANVNEYKIPFDEVIKKNNGAKLVYEFDAADVHKSYIYPAMARSFREAGIQIATHFAYEPIYLAHANTEYNTHYMNLAYTPSKAIALMISGKIFREIPMYRDLGTYPQNLKFGNFEINYENDLAVYNSAEEFIYTNTNSHKLKNLNSIKKIAGVGDSEVIKYTGTGAYFLDRIEKGVWRLEVMPDVVLIGNPFGRNNLDKPVAVINWQSRNMSINLKDLGSDFSIIPLNEGNNYNPTIKGNSFGIQPGTYLLSGKGVKTKLQGNESWNNIKLNEYKAPKSTVGKTHVVHESVNEVVAGGEILEIKAQIVSNEEIDKVEVWFQNGNRYKAVSFQAGEKYSYTAEVPQELMVPGFLKYRIIVYTGNSTQTFPADVEGNPGQWDFYEMDSYSVKIMEKGSPLYFFNSATDSEYIVGKWQPGNQLVPGSTPGEAEYQVRVEQLFEEDEENRNAQPVYDYSFKYNFNRKIKGRKAGLGNHSKLILKGRNLGEGPKLIQVALVDKHGSSFGKIIELQPGERDHVIALSELRQVKTVTLPRPYPTFLPYYFEHNNKGGLNMQNIEGIQISIGPGMQVQDLQKAHGIGITSIRLE